MILFNTTYCIDKPCADAFIEYLRDVYIPAAEELGFYAPLITEMRGPGEPNALTGAETRTFALQLRVPSEDVFNKFQTSVLPGLYSTLGKQFGSSVALFESALDVIHDPSKK